MNAIIAEYVARGCPPVVPSDIVTLDNPNVIITPLTSTVSFSLLRMVWMAGDEQSIRHVLPSVSTNIGDYEMQEGVTINYDFDPIKVILSMIITDLPNDILLMAIDMSPVDRLAEFLAGRAQPVASVVGPDLAIKIADRIGDYRGIMEVEARYAIGEDVI